MATTSEVKAGLVDVSTEIRQVRFEASRCKTSVNNLKAALDNLPTKYSDLLDTVDGYAPSGAFETLSKDEVAKLTTEFQALKTDLTVAQTALNALTEF